MRELCWMVEGRVESLDAIGWGHFSNLMAHISNCLRFKQGQKIIRAEDINPYVEEAEPLKVPITVLGQLFVPGFEETQ